MIIKLKDRVIELRLNGFSVRQIAEELRCSRSTASKYSKGLRPNNCKYKNTIAASHQNKQNWITKKRQICNEAISEWPELRLNSSFMGFLGLYWGEGFKSGMVGISNGNPAIIKLSYEFFKVRTDKELKLIIIYYKDHDPVRLECAWRDILGDDIKIIIKKNQDKRSGKKPGKLQYGMGILRFNDWKLENKIKQWISLWYDEIMIKRIYT